MPFPHSLWPRRPEGCGFGPCVNSLERGGGSCLLCDVIAHLPQQASGVMQLAAREMKNAARDGVGKLKGGENLAFKKRHREGAHRGSHR